MAFGIFRRRWIPVLMGRIADNWHIEDNLTLLQQLGVVAP